MKVLYYLLLCYYACLLALLVLYYIIMLHSIKLSAIFLRPGYMRFDEGIVALINEKVGATVVLLPLNLHNFCISILIYLPRCQYYHYHFTQPSYQPQSKTKFCPPGSSKVISPDEFNYNRQILTQDGP